MKITKFSTIAENLFISRNGKKFEIKVSACFTLTNPQIQELLEWGIIEGMKILSMYKLFVITEQTRKANRFEDARCRANFIMNHLKEISRLEMKDFRLEICDTDFELKDCHPLLEKLSQQVPKSIESLIGFCKTLLDGKKQGDDTVILYSWYIQNHPLVERWVESAF